MVNGSETGPRRTLGAFDAACVVIGAIIGVGIFFNPSKIVQLTGSGGAALAAWAIAGFLALCGALAFAELGKRYHASGAQYEVLRDAYGPMPAFLFVFCNATAIQAGAIGVISVVCAQYLGVAVTNETPEGPALLVAACVLIAGITAANIVGVKWGSQIQNLTVVAKVLTLLLVVGLAAFGTGHIAAADTAPAAAAGGNVFKGITAALIPAFFAYGGWQHALWISGEVKDPERNLPRAIFGGVVLVVVIYLLANWAYLSLLGVDGVANSKTLAADAVSVVWPDFGKRFVGAAVGLSAFGVLNAQLLSGPRLVYGMAHDGRFFAPFAKLSPKFGTPVAAILMLACTGTALLFAAGANENGVNKLIAGAVLIDGVFFALTGAALLVLERRTRAYRSTPLVKAAVVLFVLGEFAIIAGAYMDKDTRIASVVAVGWIAAVGLLYFVRFARQAKPA